MEKRKFICPKCQCEEFVSDQIQATGGTMAKLFDVQNKKFITISCKQCGFTEFYKAKTSTGMNILDFLTS
ncbi:zinc ribbon domain-containing protein [Clostridium sp. LIBA-8841]|uniref:zinc ribbon domain-containing protein n=1 Tax=Clostridium sp. LIBA-8841 TaxID=2987530 RepID=UPI002AC4D5D2|nr:zinc ribbon domain-containing protein [Clostridium sp. LIBA-8841]MDZ5253541.1 zinc ribbon domain-containing protein [Clostridium sp. LIBA-8841]